MQRGARGGYVDIPGYCMEPLNCICYITCRLDHWKDSISVRLASWYP